MECYIRKSEEICGCIPWDYPHVKEDANLCDGLATFCFESAMEAGFSQDECNCLENCKETQYIVSAISRHFIDTSKECYRKSNNERFISEYNFDSGGYFGRSHFRETFDFLKEYDLSILIGEMLR